jgi:hypothetical protein
LTGWESIIATGGRGDAGPGNIILFFSPFSFGKTKKGQTNDGALWSTVWLPSHLRRPNPSPFHSASGIAVLLLPLPTSTPPPRSQSGTLRRSAALCRLRSVPSLGSLSVQVIPLRSSSFHRSERGLVEVLVRQGYCARLARG